MPAQLFLINFLFSVRGRFAMWRLLNMANEQSPLRIPSPGQGTQALPRWDAPGKRFAEGVLMKSLQLGRMALGLAAIAAVLGLGLWVSAQETGSKKEPDKQVDK